MPLLLVSVFIAVVACDDEIEVTEEENCFEAEVIDIHPWLGCSPMLIDETEKNYLHQLVIKGNSTYDTIFTRLLTDHYESGERNITIKIDSATHLSLICNTFFGTEDHPNIWVTELLAPCE